jgi:hypothetical protein
VAEVPAVAERAEVSSEKVHDGRPPGKTLTIRSSVTEMFRAGDASPRKWLCFRLAYYRLEIDGLIFSGRALCEEVASICNSFGAPCSLDREKAPPGYKIQQFKDR